MACIVYWSSWIDKNAGGEEDLEGGASYHPELQRIHTPRLYGGSAPFTEVNTEMLNGFCSFNMIHRQMIWQGFSEGFM